MSQKTKVILRIISKLWTHKNFKRRVAYFTKYLTSSSTPKEAVLLILIELK